MSQSYQQQFDSAMRCQTKGDAQAWMNREITRYKTQFGKEPEEAQRIILINLGYMAGYYDSATADKVHELFGAVHPIFGSGNYFETVTPEQAFEAGRTKGKE